MTLFENWIADPHETGDFVYYTGFLSEDFLERRKQPDDCKLAWRLANEGRLHLFQHRLTQGVERHRSSWQYKARKVKS